MFFELSLICLLTDDASASNAASSSNSANPAATSPSGSNSTSGNNTGSALSLQGLSGMSVALAAVGLTALTL